MDTSHAVHSQSYLLEAVDGDAVYHTRIEVRDRRPLTGWSAKTWEQKVVPMLNQLLPGAELRRIIKVPEVVDDQATFGVDITLIFGISARPIVQERRNRYADTLAPSGYTIEKMEDGYSMSNPSFALTPTSVGSQDCELSEAESQNEE
jgi:hypothetical protein